MAETVLQQIRRKCFAIERAYTQGQCGPRELNSINACILNFSRIATDLSSETSEEIRSSLLELKIILSAQQDTGPGRPSFVVTRVRSNRRGRPAIDISQQQIEFLMKQGFTIKQIATITGCSASFLYKKTKILGIAVRSTQAPLTNEELNHHVRRLHDIYPNSGCEMMRGLLRTEGLYASRRRVREALTQANPAAAARRWSSAVARRVYHVPYPNSLWHMDGNMKLIRWGFVVHGTINGKSRLITYLNCNTNNRASTVLAQFVKATCIYGLPSRVRSDYGGENSQVALFMNLVQGVDRGSHITGESVHNQRIERLWRDVFLQVLLHYYNQFYALENSELLDPENDIHKLSLQVTFLPEIQRRLDHFRDAWNHHKLRTENNQTPVQIWIAGMLSNMGSDSVAINNVFGEDPYNEQSLEGLMARHGIDAFPSTDDDNQHFPAVEVGQPQIQLSPHQQQRICDAIEGITDSTTKFQTCCTEIATMMQDA